MIFQKQMVFFSSKEIGIQIIWKKLAFGLTLHLEIYDFNLYLVINFVKYSWQIHAVQYNRHYPYMAYWD